MMRTLRALIETRRKLALLLVVLAFCIKAVVPTGFMLSSARDTFLTVTICSDASGTPVVMKLRIPGKSRGEHPEGAAKTEHCAFSGLAQPALGGTDAILLAIAFAIIVMLGLCPTRIAVFSKLGRLRPPLRGPPAFA